MPNQSGPLLSLAKSKFEYPSVTTVPNAGKRLLETDVKFFISPLECRRNSKGNGDLVSDIGVVIVFQPLQILMTQKQDGHFSCMPETFYAHKRGLHQGRGL
ncbi:hypothetical protein SDJN02_13306 [Cucurbita argyrosperma subsp. argyrosperma]